MAAAARTDLVRYFELELAGCRGRPELHRHELDMHERWLAQARRAGDAAELYRALSGCSERPALARARWLDRCRALACLHLARADEPRRRAAAALYRAGQERAFPAAAVATKAHLASAQATRAAGREALAPLALALLDWRAEADAAIWTERLREVQALWRAVCAGAPRAARGSWTRIAAYPPYRHRLPFGPNTLQALGRWLAAALARPWPQRRGSDPALALAATQAAAVARIPTAASPEDILAPSAIPDLLSELVGAGADAGADADTVDALIQPYRAAYDEQVRTGPVGAETRQAYSRVFAAAATATTGPALLCRLAESRALVDLARAPHIDRARARLARAEAQPHLFHHLSRLIDALRGCETTTEVAFELACHHHDLAVENAWHEIALGYAGRAVRAVLAYDARPGAAAQETVVRSQQVVGELFGRGFEAMLTVPYMRDLVDGTLFEAIRAGQPPGPPEPGQVGLALMRAARRAVAALQTAKVRALVERTPPPPPERIAALVSEPPFANPAALRRHLADRARELTAAPAAPIPDPPGTEAATTLLLWDQAFPVDDLHERLAAPPRPPVPLDDEAALAFAGEPPGEHDDALDQPTGDE
ncbi:hypothetical protein [Haliangium sp.]|uniref:hypothetical protein n=1 Tax=Haliangium sp. TaxID=2663208 RepID=UPI003D0ECF70